MVRITSAKRPIRESRKSLNDPGERLIVQRSGTRYCVVFQAWAFFPPPTCWLIRTFYDDDDDEVSSVKDYRFFMVLGAIKK
jgi:hypothetical protein